MDEFEHGGVRYAVQRHYAVPDSSWIVELSESEPAPAAWADRPGAVSRLPGRAFLTAVVPDGDPAAEPSLHLHGGAEHDVPWTVVRWFMARVAEEVGRR